MKYIWRSIVIVLLVFLTFPLVGIDRAVTSGDYTVHRGETLHGGMFISSPGKVTIEEGARVDGAIWMSSGVLNLNGTVGGGIFSLSGEINTGPNAVVNGHTTVTSVPFDPNPSTRFNNHVTADVAGWMGGPIGTALVLVALSFYLVFGSTIASVIFRRAQADRATDEDDARRRAVVLTAGMLVVAAGALFVARALGAEIDQVVFGLALLLPGLALFGVMFLRGRKESPLAPAAGILVAAGAVTLFQGAIGHWESWAYAWALVLPASIGVGRVLEGWWVRNTQRERDGVKLAGVGAALFVASWVFFEVIVPATDYGWLFLLALVLISAGLYLMIGRGRHPGRQVTAA